MSSIMSPVSVLELTLRDWLKRLNSPNIGKFLKLVTATGDKKKNKPHEIWTWHLTKLSAFRENLALFWYFLMMDFCWARGKVLFIAKTGTDWTTDWTDLDFGVVLLSFPPQNVSLLSLQDILRVNVMNNLGPKRDVDMKEFEFEFDDELFGESNCRERKVEEAYKPKQCDPEVCFSVSL